MKANALCHPVELDGGKVIYIPSSIPNSLRKFVNLNHLVSINNEMDSFKNKIKEIKR